MKTNKNLLLVVLAFCTLHFALSTAKAQGTAFTYQGQLQSSGTPANGHYDLTFALYTASTGGSQVGSTFTSLDVGVTNGLFIVTNDFGPEYNGTAYWLQIGVRTNTGGSGTFIPLSPRQELTPAPYAVTAENVTGAITLAQLPSTVVTNNEPSVTLDNVTLGGILNLPATTTINSGGSSLLYADGNGDFFAGQGTGNEATSGGNNTAIGDGALAVNTTGKNNTANGNSALSLNTTGQWNEANGYLALSFNTNGSFNTADGAVSLYRNTNGSANTANGFEALQQNGSGSANTASGTQALEYNVTGSNNTAVGAGAMNELGLVGSAGGSENIAIGYNAGVNFLTNETSNIDIGNPGVYGENNIIRIGSNQTTAYIAGVITGNGGGLTNVSAALLADPGTGNFFAGQDAGNASVSGPYNTAVGDGSLSIVSSGSYNTALGNDALVINTTGSSNTAVGTDALGFTETGSYNTAVGVSALLRSTGGGNSAVGVSALNGNENGYNNVAVGYQAILDETDSIDNVAVGVAAFQTMSSGGQNTAVGTYAFQNMTAGSGNVGLGYYAGNALNAGSNNIYIGNPGSANDNNIIRIGNGQSETYIAGGDTYIDGAVFFDGSDTNNGLVYITGDDLPGITSGEGPFLYGYYGGWLGAVGPTTVCLSWDYSGDVWVNQNLSTATLTIRGGSDLAEPFKITSDNDEIPQGSVMVIDEENPGRLKVSSQPYDTRVAGVLSGANGINPGIQMQQQGLLEGGKNVALTGRVYVLADASYGTIKPGDLLTTSATPGHAMKVKNHAKAQGAILGKAMSGLKQGKGMVLVLVTLQ